jgi:hypothetical protein
MRPWRSALIKACLDSIEGKLSLPRYCRRSQDQNQNDTTLRRTMSCGDELFCVPLTWRVYASRK